MVMFGRGAESVDHQEQMPNRESREPLEGTIGRPSLGRSGWQRFSSGVLAGEGDARGFWSA